MVFYAHHGALPQEQELGQRFYVDVEFEGDFSAAAQSDDLRDAVSYVEVYASVKRAVEGRKYRLLEALGGAIAERLLDEFRAIREVRIRVRKPGAAVPGPLDWVELETSRSR
jgi:dihydroneopterin aldolase